MTDGYSGSSECIRVGTRFECMHMSVFPSVLGLFQESAISDIDRYTNQTARERKRERERDDMSDDFTP